MLERLDYFEQPQQPQLEIVPTVDQTTDIVSSSPVSDLVNIVCPQEDVEGFMEYYGGCGKWITGQGRNGDPKINTVLSSERYLSQDLVNGDRNDYFMQYLEGYNGQGEGVCNPKSVAWSGNDETIRVLKVEWQAETSELKAHYLDAKDLRYNMEDYRRFKDQQARKARLDQIRQELSNLRNIDAEDSLDLAAG